MYHNCNRKNKPKLIQSQQLSMRCVDGSASGRVCLGPWLQWLQTGQWRCQRSAWLWCLWLWWTETFAQCFSLQWQHQTIGCLTFGFTFFGCLTSVTKRKTQHNNTLIQLIDYILAAIYSEITISAQLHNPICLLAYFTIGCQQFSTNKLFKNPKWICRR